MKILIVNVPKLGYFQFVITDNQSIAEQFFLEKDQLVAVFRVC